jgi:hypothetical protein
VVECMVAEQRCGWGTTMGSPSKSGRLPAGRSRPGFNIQCPYFANLSFAYLLCPGIPPSGVLGHNVDIWLINRVATGGR